MIGAFAYLVITSARNTFVSRLRRIRNPRYAIALAFGLAYFGLIFFNPSAGGQDGSAAMGELLALIAPTLVLVVVLHAWIFGSSRSALAFTEAEVSLLFTAPVSRRGLIVYKLVRSQGGVLITSALWVIFFRRGGGALEQGVAYWMLLTTITLHRLGAALVRASYGQSAGAGLRRTWVATLFIGAIAAAAVIGFMNARPVLATFTGPRDLARIVTTVLETEPLSLALLPFTLVTAPALTAPGAAWDAAIVPALLILALHVWWVLRTETAFEEAAAEASAEQARLVMAMRTRGVMDTTISSRNARRTLPLSTSGPPSLALVWKNFLWILRTGQQRAILGVPLVAAICTAAFAPRSQVAAVMIVAACGALTVMTIFFGPASVRSDLRRELGRLELMKTLPLRGRQIMLAEVASSACALWVMQALLALVAVVALGFAPEAAPPADVRIGLLIGLPALVAGLNLANFTIHNGLALLFPAWVRIGDTGSQGVEMMGQVMLVMVITTAMLAILMVPAALFGAGFWVYFRLQPVLAISLSCSGAGAMLAVEAYLMILVLGRSLERLEPSHVS